jgi:phosphatidylserine decarboxylase
MAPVPIPQPIPGTNVVPMPMNTHPNSVPARIDPDLNSIGIHPCQESIRWWPSVIIANIYTWVLGLVSKIYIPECMRSLIFGIYVWIYGIDMREYGSCLEKYKNLNEFFSRELAPHSRFICIDSPFVSPCDGSISSAGLLQVTGNDTCVLDNTLLASVKGIRYKLSTFLGESCSDPESNSEAFLDNPTPRYIAYFVIYLSPADCHRFYSPANVTVNQIRHVSGEHLPVSGNSWIFPCLENVLTLNERIVTLGTWNLPADFFPVYDQNQTVSAQERDYSTRGADLRFSMVMVSATGVGHVVFRAGGIEERFTGSGTEQFFQRTALEKGEEMGHFELGSTIVLIFELPSTPSNLVFAVKQKQKVKIGQPLLLSKGSL